MGNSNSVPNCEQIKIDLEKCCLKKNNGELNIPSDSKKSNECPCKKLKELYIDKCDSKEDIKKLLINC